MDIGTGADVSEKGTVPRIARNSGVFNPTIRAIVATQPIFHSEFLPRVKVPDIGFKATIKILRMNTLRPAATEFLVHVATAKSQPRPVEPDALLVRTGHPDHHWGGIHDLTESRVQPAGKFNRKISWS